MTSPDRNAEDAGTVLLVGASRGLGHAMAAEFLKRGWTVIGTVRGDARSLLHDLADAHPGRVAIEQLDINEPEQAALNQYMRSYAVRQQGRALVLVAPGWIRTELGGPDAPFGMEETVPQIVDMLLGQRGWPGLRYLDREGHTVPW
ncbi:MAG: SDR family NAD(P)-dependent oxidoreductase [Pseudoxanthomonas sp.]